jgi:hypothetical protein
LDLGFELATKSRTERVYIQELCGF